MLLTTIALAKKKKTAGVSSRVQGSVVDLRKDVFLLIWALSPSLATGSVLVRLNAVFLYKLVFCLSLPDRHHHQQCEHLPVPDRGHGSGVVRQGLARSAKRWHEETNLPARDSHPGTFYICFQNHQPLHIYLDLHEFLAQ